jgi:hypothetical protein
MLSDRGKGWIIAAALALLVWYWIGKTIGAI